jgi:putative SOS response-associated peptidase YedK
MKDGAPFAFAGVWDRWKSNGNTLYSCAIITTTANELLSTIHHRMPVIMPPELHDLWLNPESRAGDLKEILVPFPAAEMISHAVSRDVNSTKSDGEQLLKPVDPMIGVNLSLF